MLTPDFSQVLGYVAGVRPYRPGGVRLEAETVGSKLVVHNYGHGGAGITLAPGAAELAADLVPAGSDVAVLGAGVVGLCTAGALLQRGHKVTVYAREFPPFTTSDVAGGVWAHIEVDESPELPRMLELSYQHYRRFAMWHPVYFTPAAVEPLPPQLKTPEPRDGLLVTETMLIFAYPGLLMADLAHVPKVQGTFGPEDVPEPVVVNCRGIDAGPEVVPIRGQLVRLPPTGENYTLIHEGGYVISRPDVCLLGGTFERGVRESVPEAAACEEILAKNRAYFER